jgi:hypothetical protein
MIKYKPEDYITALQQGAWVLDLELLPVDPRKLQLLLGDKTATAAIVTSNHDWRTNTCQTSVQLSMDGFGVTYNLDTYGERVLKEPAWVAAVMLGALDHYLKGYDD